MEAMMLGAHHRIPLERGNGYVVIEWAGIVYVSPNCGWAAFEEFLDEVGDCVRRHLPRQVLVLWNFNAHSTEWGNPRTDARGRELSDWVADGVNTCVARRGCSVVDIIWATPVQTGFRLESGREGRDTLGPPLHVHGGEENT